MLNCILIDDEPNAIRALELELKQFENRATILEKFNNVNEAVARIKHVNFELLFLDIEMPGMNGMSFLEQFPDRDFEVIFTTAYSHYAVEAIKKSALDYLLKPVDTDELEGALIKAEATIQRYRFDTKLEKALDNLQVTHGHLNRIKLNHDGKIFFLKPEDILYCKGEGNYCYIFLENNENMLLSMKLKQVEELLPSGLFCRVHNSYIVNLSKVRSYHKAEGMIELYSGFVVPVSREKRSSVLDKL